MDLWDLQIVTLRFYLHITHLFELKFSNASIPQTQTSKTKSKHKCPHNQHNGSFFRSSFAFFSFLSFLWMAQKWCQTTKPCKTNQLNNRMHCSKWKYISARLLHVLKHVFLLVLAVMPLTRSDQVPMETVP